MGERTEIEIDRSKLRMREKCVHSPGAGRLWCGEVRGKGEQVSKDPKGRSERCGQGYIGSLTLFPILCWLLVSMVSSFCYVTRTLDVRGDSDLGGGVLRAQALSHVRDLNGGGQ